MSMTKYAEKNNPQMMIKTNKFSTINMSNCNDGNSFSTRNLNVSGMMSSKNKMTNSMHIINSPGELGLIQNQGKKIELKYPKHEKKFNIYFNNANALSGSINSISYYKLNNNNMNNNVYNNPNNFNNANNIYNTPSPAKRKEYMSSNDLIQDQKNILSEKKKAYTVRKTVPKKKFIIASTTLSNFKEDLGTSNETFKKDFTEMVFDNRVELVKTTLNTLKLPSIKPSKIVFPNIHGNVNLKDLLTEECEENSNAENEDGGDNFEIRIVERNGEAIYESRRKSMKTILSERRSIKGSVDFNLSSFNTNSNSNNTRTKRNESSQDPLKNPVCLKNCFVEAKPFFHNRNLYFKQDEHSKRIIETKDKLSMITDKINVNLKQILKKIDDEKIK